MKSECNNMHGERIKIVPLGFSCRQGDSLHRCFQIGAGALLVSYRKIECIQEPLRPATHFRCTDTIQPLIITNWYYNPLWGFPFSVKFLQVLPSLATSFQFLTFSFFKSPMTSSCHRCLGLPTGLVPIGFQSSSFPVGLAWSILWICPSRLIFCTLTL